MARKTVLVADPGIDTAFAIGLALNDPDLNVVGIIASAGNVRAEQATHNVRIILEQIDPPRLPRLGAALPIPSENNGEELHGPCGLGGANFPVAKRHEPASGEKVLVEIIRESPHEVSIACLGPATMIARALDRDPELGALIQRIILMGGAWREPGDAGAVVEFHFACDPAAARQVLACEAPITLIPLDVSRKVIFSPTDLLNLPEPEARTCQFLRQIVPFGIRASANLYGVEGFHLCDVLGVVAQARPEALTLRPMPADVEVAGELTRGMSVIDARPQPAGRATVDLATAVDVDAVRMYIKDILGSSI